ncbi:MAG: hypothetical protein ACTSX9_00195 [Candidatus Njordarchaeales archaeon]
MKRNKTIEREEDIFVLTKMVVGLVLGAILGLLDITGIYGFLIAILILALVIAAFKLTRLREVPILKLALWDGTFSYFILLIVSWALFWNFF